MNQQKIIEELESIEAFAVSLLQKCYSVKQLLSPAGFHPRASFKKNAQTKINQVIANRNNAIKRKSNTLKSMIIFIFFFGSVGAQSLTLPEIDSLDCSIDTYYDDLTESEVQEFKSSNKKRWLNYLPSPGYSPFSGGFTFSINLAAPLQEAKFSNISKNKIASIKRINMLGAKLLKNEVYCDYKAVEISITEFKLKDSLEYLKLKAFKIFKTQYERNEITPSDFLAKQYEIQSIQTARIIERNNIYKSILLLLLKSKQRVQTNAPSE